MVWPELLTCAGAPLERISSLAKSSETTGKAVEPVPHRFLDMIARRYRGALNSFFRRRLGAGRDDCEDLTQEVLLRLAHRGHLGDVAKLEPYIFRAASGVLVDHVRRQRTRLAGSRESYDEERHAPADFSPERVLLGKEDVDRVLAAIEALPERARHALMLFRFEGLKQGEIASRMGITVSAVEKHVRLGMLRMTEALRGEP